MSIDSLPEFVLAVSALAGFVFGIFKFLSIQSIEAQRPYLERKLSWSEEAVEVTARIANARVPSQDDIQRFWQLYWGVMCMIEQTSITNAMIGFGKALKRQQQTGQVLEVIDPDHPTEMQQKSLLLAHACRLELSIEWSSSWSRNTAVHQRPSDQRTLGPVKPDD